MTRQRYNRLINKKPNIIVPKSNAPMTIAPVKYETTSLEYPDHAPLVTCITPTFGRLSFLQEMLWCWVNQDYINKELIIINDQENLILETDIPNVHIYNFQERFVGLGAKRNFAVSKAHPSSTMICPFDDDDLFFPEHITFLVNTFKSDPTIERTKNINHWVSIDNDHFTLGYDPGNTYFGASCFRKKVFDDYKLKDYLIMGEDADLFENKKLSMRIGANPLKSSFVHRRGMGIPHASTVRQMSYDQKIQKEIANEMQKHVIKTTQSTTVKLIPALASGEKLYKKIDIARKA